MNAQGERVKGPVDGIRFIIVVLIITTRIRINVVVLFTSKNR